MTYAHRLQRSIRASGLTAVMVLLSLLFAALPANPAEA